ncbi:MAG TPA: hypothetical protein VK601_03830, partial [Kofleriaceae bacterium]|nr:hypothetical protein [Kofleriaceae bacterium]
PGPGLRERRSASPSSARIAIMYIDAGFDGDTWIFLEPTGCDGIAAGRSDAVKRGFTYAVVTSHGSHFL